MGAKVWIYRTSGGSVSCKVNLGDDGRSITYHRGKGKKYRWNHGEYHKEYPLIVSFSYLEEFLDVNGVNYKNVEIDPRSVDKFYGYSDWSRDHYFVNLTPANVNRWWNHDCPDLYRYTVNKERRSNWFGLNLICFSNKLVECGWSGTYIDEDITKEEVEKITRGHETSHVAEEMWRVLNAQTLSDGEIEYLVEEVRKYEEKIQAVIDKHQDEILASIQGMVDGSYGLDCGFLNIYTKNPKHNEQKGLLKNVKANDISHAPWMNVRMPYEPQSLTIKQKEFQKVKEIVQRETGEELYCTTMLD